MYFFFTVKSLNVEERRIGKQTGNVYSYIVVGRLTSVFGLFLTHQTSFYYNIHIIITIIFLFLVGFGERELNLKKIIACYG